MSKRLILSVTFRVLAHVVGIGAWVIAGLFYIGHIELNPFRLIYESFSQNPWPTIESLNGIDGLFGVVLLAGGYVLGGFLWGYPIFLVSQLLDEVASIFSFDTLSEYKKHNADKAGMELKARQLGSVKTVTYISGGMLIETDIGVYKVAGRHCHIPSESIVWLELADFLLGQRLCVKSPDGTFKTFQYLGKGMA